MNAVFAKIDRALLGGMKKGREGRKGRKGKGIIRCDIHHRSG